MINLWFSPQGNTRKKSGLVGASFNFINSIIGAGIIGLAFALKECGFVLGIALLVLVALLTDYTVRLLINLGQETGMKSYEDLAEHCLGRFGFYFVSSLMTLMAFGAMCAYMVVIGDTVPQVFESFLGPGHVLASRPFVVSAFGFVFILPLCLLRDMASLSISSMISIVAIGVIVLIVAVRAPAVSEVTASDDPQGLNFLSSNMFAGLGAISFAYTCHHSAFIVQQSLHNPTTARWKKVSNYSVAVALAASLMLSISGYAAFYSDTKGDVLNNFTAGDSSVNFARILLAFTMVFTFPMEQYVARHCLQAVLFRGRGPSSSLRHFSITFILYALAWSVGMASTDLGILLELTGGFSASALGYCVPSLLYFCVHPHSALVKKASQRASFVERSKALCTDVWVPLGIFVFGLVAMIAGTVNSIANATGGHD